MPEAVTDYLDRAISAQPCTYVAGEWLRHPTGAIGRVYEDLGREVRVDVNCLLGWLPLIWDKKGVRMIAEPGKGTLRDAYGARSTFDDVDQ